MNRRDEHPPREPHGDEPSAHWRRAAAPFRASAWWLCALVIACAAMTLWVLTYPFDFTADAPGGWLTHNDIRQINTLSNVLLFMPWGLLAAWLGWRVGLPRAAAVTVAALDGLFLSFIGESAQAFLPERASSAVDLLTNTLGATLGAIIGYRLAPMLHARWRRIVAYFEAAPAGRRMLMVLILVLIARTFPFNFSAEIAYLKEELFATVNAGGLLGRLRDGGTRQLLAAAATFILHGTATLAIGRAVREALRRLGDRATATGMVTLLGLSLVLVTELLQWPIRSRTLDLADLLAGCLGVGVALLVYRGALPSPAAGSGRG